MSDKTDFEEAGIKHPRDDDFDFHEDKADDHREEAARYRKLAKIHREGGRPKIGNAISKMARLHDELADHHTHVSELWDTIGSDGKEGRKKDEYD